MFKVLNVNNKTPDWKVVTLMGADGDSIENVSVNRTNKRGEVFPGFDTIVPNGNIEGRLWQSPAGKQYLFAPNAPRAQARSDMSPAANNGATAELKNILMLKVIPELAQINGRLGILLKQAGIKTDDYLNPDDVPF